MAEHAETVEFWKGAVVGTLFGLVAAAYARGDFRRLFSMVPCAEPQPAAIPPVDSKAAFRDHSAELKLRREDSENAGDPTQLSSAALGSDLAPQAISIERTGGAPGPASTARSLKFPAAPAS
jgi:hypothetical protein